MTRSLTPPLAGSAAAEKCKLWSPYESPSSSVLIEFIVQVWAPPLRQWAPPPWIHMLWRHWRSSLQHIFPASSAHVHFLVCLQRREETWEVCLVLLSVADQLLRNNTPLREKEAAQEPELHALLLNCIELSSELSRRLNADFYRGIWRVRARLLFLYIVAISIIFGWRECYFPKTLLVCLTCCQMDYFSFSRCSHINLVSNHFLLDFVVGECCFSKTISWL